MALVVGEEPVVANKSLLASYSEFFDGLLFGKFIEAVQTEVMLPDLDSDAIKAYIRWTYTGHIESKLSLINLWILGDRLCSTKFKNDVMYLLFSTLYEECIMPGEIHLAYENTTPNSKLRLYITDYVTTSQIWALAMGSVTSADQANLDKESRDWIKLIRNGGDFVLEVLLKGGFHRIQAAEEYAAIDWQRSEEYLEDEPMARDVDEFIRGKARGARKRRIGMSCA